MSVEFTTGVGRIVWGHPLKAQNLTDDDDKPRLKEDGTQMQGWSFGLAIPKTEFAELGAALQAATAEVFPNGTPADYAWKVKDGDSAVDSKGKPLRDKPGQAGCFILNVSTQYQAPDVFAWDFASNKWVQTDRIKTGDYVKVVLDIKSHTAKSSKAKPGLYLNPRSIVLWQVGDEIKGAAIDPNERFSAPPPPANMGQMPGAEQPTAPQAPFAGAPAAPQAPAAAPGAGPFGGAPSAPVAPHTQFLQGPGAAPGGGAKPPF